jgi:alpha-amylase
MVLVSDKLERAEQKLGSDGKHALDHARRELYRAQCNCSYWHGLFGGLYLNYLRDTVYRHLIEAELHADRVLGTTDQPTTEVRDLDADLQPEVLLTDADVAAYLKPDQGGGVYELDFRPRRFNVLNVLARRPEGYHRKMAAAARGQGNSGGGVQSIHDLVAVKSAGLEDLTTYDRAPRFLFIDHFIGADTSLDGMAHGRFQERGDFATGAYRIVDKGAGAVTLRRDGNIFGVPATVEKTVTLRGATLTCRWRITVEQSLTETFAPELNLTMLAGDAPDRYYRVPGSSLPPEARKLASRGEVQPGSAGAVLELVNEWDKFSVRITATPATTLWRFPLETASQSESGFERTYQGSVILPVWRDLQLQARRPFEAQVTVELEPLP